MASVFICHRGADQDAAERLARELQNRNYVVWLDIWKINIGDSIIERVNDGLSGSSHLVLCYSDTDSMDPWMTRGLDGPSAPTRRNVTGCRQPRNQQPSAPAHKLRSPRSQHADTQMPPARPPTATSSDVTS